MNRKQLITWLKSLGYTGSFKTADVEAYLTAEGYDPDHLDFTIKGKSVRVSAANVLKAKPEPVTLSDEDEDADDASPRGKSRRAGAADEDDAQGRIAELEATVKQLTEKNRLEGGNTRLAKIDGDDTIAIDAKDWRQRAERKAYDRKSARGETVFPDSSIAEVCGAYMRLKMANIANDGKPVDYELKAADLDIIKKAHVEYDNSLGGSFVPVEFENYLISLKESYQDPRSMFRTVPMSRDSMIVPKDTGDLTVYAPGEGVGITASTGATGTVELVGKKLAVLSTVSVELLADSQINVAEWVGRKIVYAFRKKELDCFINGDGTSTYFGFNGVRNALKGLHATIANISGLFVGAGNNYSELTLSDFSNTEGLLPDFDAIAAGDPEWYVNKRFYFNVMVRLALAAGGVTAGEIEGKRAPMFNGYKVNFVRSMPRTEGNSQVCALFGWPQLAATIGSIKGVTITQSDQRYFDQDLIAFKGIERVAFQAHDVGDANATEASRNPGPLVGLITAAS